MDRHTTPSTLAADAAVAAAGDRLILAAGSYPAFIAPAGLPKAEPGVTLEPEAGARVAIAGILFAGGGGWTFRGPLEITPHEGACIEVERSQRLHFEGLDIHGDTALQPGVEWRRGLNFRTSKDISVTDCNIHHVAVGLGHVDCDGLTFTRNEIHDLRGDGIAGASDNVRVEDNFIHDMFPQPTDHPDGIQFWTTNRQTGPVNLRITGNRLRRGRGGAFQGVFLNNESHLRYSNVVITDNEVTSGAWNGIYLVEADGVVVDHNYVQGFVDAMGSGQVMTPWILVQGSTNGSVKNNLASGGYKLEGNTAFVAGHNGSIPLARSQDYSGADRWRFEPLDPKHPARSDSGPQIAQAGVMLMSLSIAAQRACSRRAVMGGLAARIASPIRL